MIIQVIDKVWGREHILTNTSRYCTKKLELWKDHFCSLHYHKIKDETFVVQSGQVKIEFSEHTFTGSNRDTKIIIFNPGDFLRVKPYILHRFTGLVDSWIIESSTRHEDTDSIRLEPSGRVK